MLLLPGFVGLAVLASLGPAFVLTALNVKYRDFRYIIPFIVQFGLYVSPVGFSSAIVPEEWRFWYSLNPVVGVIDGFRWCILGGESPLYLPGFLLSLAVVAACSVARDSRISAAPNAASPICSEPGWLMTRRKMADDVVIRAEGLGKKYVIGHAADAGALCRVARRAGARRPRGIAPDRRHAARPCRRRGDTIEEFWALQRRQLRGQARRGSRHHRPQRRRQIDPAENPVAASPSRPRAASRSRAASPACSKSAPGFIPS